MRLYKLALYCAVAAFGALASRAQSADALSPDQLVAATYTQSLVYTVLPTGSMKPTFDENWLLLVAIPSFSSVHVGDIIVYRAPSGFTHESTDLVVHRVVARSSAGGALITRGDAMLRSDPFLVTESMYVGRVVGLIAKPRIEP